MADLLSICQDAADLIGIPRPVEVVNSTDQQVRQLLALAKEEGHELATSHPWEILNRQHTFTTVAAEEQPDAVPDDWDRFLPNSFFNRTTRLEVIGPITPQVWQAIMAQPQLNRVYLAFRERDNKFLITPNPTAGQTIAYEYISKNWVEAADGELKPTFTADTDTPLLESRLFVLGLRWRFRKTKGLDYAEDYKTYQKEVQKVQGKDGGSTKLDITGRNLYNQWGYPNLPLGNFPG
jgi:hypothetical protein